jgi:hypothetical protein
MSGVDDRALNELRQLARRDAELSALALELRRLDEEVGAIRSRAEAAEEVLAAYPEEERRAASALEAATAELAERRREEADAEHALASARDAEVREHAERALARAADHVAVARARVERSEAVAAGLRRDADAIPRELAELNERAGRLDGVPPPHAVSSLVEWAARAHAELFVAAGQLDARRERVIREANELASMLLGEPTYGATVAQALARAERHCVSAPGQVSESR